MDKRKGKNITRKRITADTDTITIGEDLALDELFDIFINAKRAEGRADRTISDHKKHYRYFREWLDLEYPDVKPADIETKTIREWITYMLDDKVAYEGHPTSPQEYVGLAPGTVNIRLRSIKCMFKFWADEGYLPQNPTVRVPILRVEDDGVHTFTPEQVKLLLTMPDKTSYAGFRDYVLMITLLDTGMRINEALSLGPDYVDTKSCVITISARITKTRKGRQVPISKKTARQLHLLMNEVKAQFGEHDRVFVSNYGENFCDNYFRTRLKKYSENANIYGVRVSPHVFRHTFAKLYIMNGGDPFTLQHILGHHDISMVRRYIQMFSSDVKAMHRRASPLEALKL